MPQGNLVVMINAPQVVLKSRVLVITTVLQENLVVVYILANVPQVVLANRVLMTATVVQENIVVLVLANATQVVLESRVLTIATVVQENRVVVAPTNVPQVVLESPVLTIATVLQANVVILMANVNQKIAMLVWLVGLLPSLLSVSLSSSSYRSQLLYFVAVVQPELQHLRGVQFMEVL